MNIVAHLPVVAGVEIPVDAEGRYNLNALHRAYEAEVGSAKHKAPNKWLENQQSLDFIKEVRDLLVHRKSGSGAKSTTCDVLNVINGGSAPGTFAHELIAVEYAGWVSVKFRVLVNQTFLDYRNGLLVPTADAIKQATYETYRELALENASSAWVMISDYFDLLYVRDFDRKHARISEANLINRVVLGMPSRDFCRWFEARPPIRASMHPTQVDAIHALEQITFSLILAGIPYEERKRILELTLAARFPLVKNFRDHTTRFLTMREAAPEGVGLPTHPLKSDILNGTFLDQMVHDAQLKLH
jgi:hypothetical protein